MTTPNINQILRNDPRPSKYGAPLGDRNVYDELHGKLYCQRVHFIDGDYGADGTYWGGGRDTLPLYCVFDTEKTTRCYYRASMRSIALRRFKEAHEP